MLYNDELLHELVGKLYPRLNTDWAQVVFTHGGEDLTLADFSEGINQLFEAEFIVNNLDDRSPPPKPSFLAAAQVYK